jgi:3-oxoacyl-[acyl-carrier protein] reductase
MDLGIRGRVAIVTGGTRGIGLAIARTLRDEGCHVAVCARSQASVDAVRDEFPLVAQADVSQADQAARFVEQAAVRFGKLEIVVNNVGGSLGGGSFTASTLDQWHAVMDANLFSALYVSKAAVPHLLAANWGRVVHVASIWGRESGGGSAYNAAKAAMISLAKSMAQDLAPHGILVNAVAPGSVLFPGGGWDRRQKADPAGIAAFVERDLPLGRFGQPPEVAAVVALLVSERASLVSGSCWTVDGGQSRSGI